MLVNAEMLRDSGLVRFTDLTKITDSRKSETLLKLIVPFAGHANPDEVEWLRMGAVSLTKHEAMKCHILQCKMGNGATDFEHDTVVVVRLPLVGLTFDSVPWGNIVIFNAVIDTVWSEEIRVPPPGYDPANDPATTKCKSCKERHLIVPEDLYCPKPNKELVDLVAGLRVEIVIGPKRDRSER